MWQVPELVLAGETWVDIEGTSGDDYLIGTSDPDHIFGRLGDDTLDGLVGADELDGGRGNDTYVVDHEADFIRELTGAGSDTLFTSVSYALPADAEVEFLSTRSHAGTDAIDLVGNRFSQILYGNAGANLLNGLEGADVMIGLQGDDTYAIDHKGDLVVELEGQGNDVVLTFVSHTLTNGNEVETLSTAAHTATTAIDLGGNDYANHLIGNYGANYLNGGGGADRLTGFLGDDTYVVDHAGDVVEEGVGAGSDTVFSFVSYALAAGQEVETLSTILHVGTGAIDLTGNNRSQTIIGNDGANIIDGKGAFDVLTGRGGADMFVFSTIIGDGNFDLVTDYSVADDMIGLDDAIFYNLAPGALPAGAFVTGSAAQDADDRIIYNSGSGFLYFDDDGAGGAAARPFAILQFGLQLTASDFVVI